MLLTCCILSFCNFAGIDGQLLQLVRPGPDMFKISVCDKGLKVKSSVGIRTHILAQMAGVTEAELVYALMTSGELNGVKIPEPLPAKHNAKTRNFDYQESLAFAKMVNAARLHEKRKAEIAKGKL